MRKNRLLIVLVTCVTVLFSITSCTYDYFADETNYLVFVPEVLDNSITDCRVMVYTESGKLVRERYAAAPWGKDPREQIGLFGFRLPQGDYKVYCYTNTDSVYFSETGSLESSHFALKEKEIGSDMYIEPSDILFHKLTPTIIHPGILKTDTAVVKKYTGRITVRFKNFPADASRIEHVNLRAERAATVQYLKEDTLTARYSEHDMMYALGKLPVQQTSGVVEVDHLFLPTVDETDKWVSLNYIFLDSSGEQIIRLPLELVDTNTGVPLRLYHGKRLIIEVDSYTIIKVSIVGWNQDIQSGDTELQ